MKPVMFFCLFLLFGCMAPFAVPDDFTPVSIHTTDFDIFTYQKITSATAPVHIYIEGDGRAFDAAGRPTRNPTPHGTFVRDLAMRDDAPNVAYVARPCQFIMSPSCSSADWTSARFSAPMVDAMSDAVAQISQARPVILIGYSGGAMISAMVISRNPDLHVVKWITIAGVLNHADWTRYFGDSPLSDSLPVNELPRIPQIHYVAQSDKVVPISLSRHWIGDAGPIIVVPNSSHDEFENLKLDFSIK